MKFPKYLVILNFASIILFILITSLITIQTPKIDNSINSFIPLIQTPSLIEFSKAIGYIFDTKLLIFAVLLISVYIFYKGFKKQSSFLASSFVIGAGLVLILKELIHRARPLNALVLETDFCFPSGHTTMSIIFIGMLIYLTNTKIKSQKAKLTSILISLILILIIISSRLYINVHFFTDIIGGIFLAIFVLTSFMILDRALFKKV